MSVRPDAPFTLPAAAPEAALAELQQWRERIEVAARERRPLQLRGGSTKSFYGEVPVGDPLDTRRFNGVVDYEPTELVVTVRCGTRVEDLERLLRNERQMLAFEPPRFGADGTVGGMVAAGLSGPRRASAGALRDFVLGAALLPADGELRYFGGQVMKNVAGYDVARLLAGSLGILGVITEVSLKVLPLPAAERSVRMPIAADAVIGALNGWGGEPLPISATAWIPPTAGGGAGELSLRFSGARAAVDQAVERFCGDLRAEVLVPDVARIFWRDLRDHQDPFFLGDDPLWRLSLPSTAPLRLPDLPESRQLVEWGGALRWLRSSADAAVVRAAAARVGGTATLFRGGWRSGSRRLGGAPAAEAVFHPLDPINWRLHQRLKATFDPTGIFNPGRMYRGL